MKPWTNKAWLHNKFIVKRMTCEAIAKELNDSGISVSQMTIYNWLVKHKLISPKSYGKRSVKGSRPSYY